MSETTQISPTPKTDAQQPSPEGGLDQKSIIILIVSIILLALVLLPILWMWIRDYLDKRRNRMQYEDCENEGQEPKKKSRPNSVCDSHSVGGGSVSRSEGGKGSVVEPLQKPLNSSKDQLDTEEEDDDDEEDQKSKDKLEEKQPETENIIELEEKTCQNGNVNGSTTIIDLGDDKKEDEEKTDKEGNL